MTAPEPDRTRPAPGAAATLARCALAMLALLAACPAMAQPSPPASDVVTRGEYVFHVAGCASCHSEADGKGPPLAGGVAVKTEFGIFYTPNISPDPEHGIGRWSEADLRRALKEGESPEGRPYYPAFPYPSYTGMSDADIAALYAYLQAQPASDRPSRPHELKFPYSMRPLLRVWRALYFTPGRSPVSPGQTPEIARGAYLVGAVGHCAECHTPRNFLGALDYGMWLAGAAHGATGGDSVPNITPDPKTGIGDWSEDNIVDLLTDGSTPDGDQVGSDMGHVVDNSARYLTPEDRRAIARYLKSIPPIVHETESAKN